MPSFPGRPTLGRIGAFLGFAGPIFLVLLGKVMHIHPYASIYIHMHPYTSICIGLPRTPREGDAYTSICIHIHPYTSIFLVLLGKVSIRESLHTCIPTYIHTYMYTHAHACRQARICAHAHMHAYVRACMHASSACSSGKVSCYNAMTLAATTLGVIPLAAHQVWMHICIHACVHVCVCARACHVMWRGDDTRRHLSLACAPGTRLGLLPRMQVWRCDLADRAGLPAGVPRAPLG